MKKPYFILKQEETTLLKLRLFEDSLPELSETKQVSLLPFVSDSNVTVYGFIKLLSFYKEIVK